jgi:hypothetical protein
VQARRDVKVDTVIEAIVALATLALAGATVWMAREIRTERIESAKERVRGSLRAALMEQLENTRRWYSAKPDRKGDDPEDYRFAQPVMTELSALARDVDLPGDAAAYLMWLIADVRRIWAEYAALLDQVKGTYHGVVEKNEARRIWGLGFDHLQVITGLIAGELRRRDHKADATVVESVRWMLPETWAGGRANTMVAQTTYLAAPRFPAYPAFAGCSAAARDQQAAEIAAATQAKLRQHQEDLSRAGL